MRSQAIQPLVTLSIEAGQIFIRQWDKRGFINLDVLRYSPTRAISPLRQRAREIAAKNNARFADYTL